MFRVFVSYSSNDLPDVHLLQSSLTNSEIDVFVAENGIAPTSRFADKICEAIKKCDLFVLVWSDNARTSEWVSQEIGKAHECKKQILPLLFSDEKILPGFIRDLNFIDCRKNKSEAMAKAREAIVQSFQMKQEFEAKIEREKKKKEEDAKVFLILGGLALWLFSK